MGELENTYVVYTADHGIAVGRHGLMESKIYMSTHGSSPYSKRAKDADYVLAVVYICSIYCRRFATKWNSFLKPFR